MIYIKGRFLSQHTELGCCQSSGYELVSNLPHQCVVIQCRSLLRVTDECAAGCRAASSNNQKFTPLNGGTCLHLASSTEHSHSRPLQQPPQSLLRPTDPQSASSQISKFIPHNRRMCPELASSETSSKFTPPNGGMCRRITNNSLPFSGYTHLHSSLAMLHHFLMEETPLIHLLTTIPNLCYLPSSSFPLLSWPYSSFACSLSLYSSSLFSSSSPQK